MPDMRPEVKVYQAEVNLDGDAIALRFWHVSGERVCEFKVSPTEKLLDIAAQLRSFTGRCLLDVTLLEGKLLSQEVARDPSATIGSFVRRDVSL